MLRRLFALASLTLPLAACGKSSAPAPAPSESIVAEPPTLAPVPSASAVVANDPRPVTTSASRSNDPHIARQAALEEAKNFGVIGKLDSGAFSALSGRDDSL